MNEKLDQDMGYIMSQIESAVVFYAALTRDDNPSKDLLEEADKLFREGINKVLDNRLGDI